MIMPLYGLGIVLTVLSTEEFVNVGWDSAGVTTGRYCALDGDGPRSKVVSAVEGSASYRSRYLPVLRCSRWGLYPHQGIMSQPQADAA